MRKRSLKSANDQIHQISENYPNHRLSNFATKVYFELCNKIADIIGIRKINDNLNGEESWYYDWNEYYSNWDTEVTMEGK